MSLVFDALRRAAPGDVQEPTRAGSVTVATRRWRPLGGITLGLLCMALVLSALWLRQTDVPQGAATVAGEVQEPAAVPIPLPLPLPHKAEIVVPTGSAVPRLQAADSQPVSAAASAGEREPPRNTRPAGTSAATVATRQPVPATPAATREGEAATGRDTPSRQPSPVAVAVAAAQPPAEASAGTQPANGTVPPMSAEALLAAFGEAMRNGQLAQADTYLEHARQMLGHQHLLVVRMEGYYCMQADCAERARQAYLSILARLPQDREAGYNLTILDWRAGKLEAARVRARSLLAQYPADQELNALLRVVEGQR